VNKHGSSEGHVVVSERIAGQWPPAPTSDKHEQELAKDSEGSLHKGQSPSFSAKRYLVAWILAWVAIIMLSMTPEMWPGVSEFMPGELIDASCGSPSVRSIADLAYWLLWIGTVELICGLFWGVLALVLHYAVRWCSKDLLSKLGRPAPVQTLKVAVVVAIVMGLAFGVPLAVITIQSRNFSMVTEDCPIIISHWAVVEEASSIVVAFVVACFVAGCPKMQQRSYRKRPDSK